MALFFRNLFFYSLTFFLLTTAACSVPKIPSTDVHIIGEMKNVMWKGELAGMINLDTIGLKNNLFGMGPIEYLRGEILIMDGKAYTSTVLSDSTMRVEESFKLKAPFFAYANIANWTETSLPNSVQTLQQLEAYLDQLTSSYPRPFMFRLDGRIQSANIHIVNLPQGSKVSNPSEAHVGQVNYQLENEEVKILGFFSTDHEAIFTHHDTYLHMHLITKKRNKMGHLDEVSFSPGSVRLFLPL